MVSSLSFLFYKIQFVIFSFFVVFFFSFLFFPTSYNRHLFLTVLKAGSPRSGCQHGLVLVRTLFLASATSLLGLHMKEREIDLFFNILLFIYLAVLATHRIFDLRFNMLDHFGCSMQDL